MSVNPSSRSIESTRIVQAAFNDHLDMLQTSEETITKRAHSFPKLPDEMFAQFRAGYPSGHLVEPFDLLRDLRQTQLSSFETINRMCCACINELYRPDFQAALEESRVINPILPQFRDAIAIRALALQARIALLTAHFFHPQVAR